MLSGEAVKPPPPSLPSSPLLKKERINLCWALCHLESDTSREAGQEGDQRGALQPGDGHSIRGGGSGVRRDWVPLTGNTLKTNPTGASDEDLILVMKVYWCW